MVDKKIETETEDTPVVEPLTQVNQILVDVPDAMSVDLMSVEGNVRTGFVNQSKEGKAARKKIRVILVAMWQGGAYNYETIAKKLRVSDQDVAAMLDEQFRARMWSAD